MSIETQTFEQLITSIEKTLPLSTELNEMLRKIIQEEFYKKGTILFHQEWQLKYLLLLKGTIREFSGPINSAKQNTEWFWHKDDFIFAMPSSFGHQSLVNHLEILEDAHVVYLSYQDYNAIITKYSQIKALFNMMAAQHNNLVIKHLNNIKNLSAAERFDILFAQRPQLFNLCKQKDIASFLGMDPETLRRVRKFKGS